MQKIKNIALTVFVFLVILVLVVVANSDFSIPSQEVPTEEVSATLSETVDPPQTQQMTDPEQAGEAQTNTKETAAAATSSAVDMGWGDPTSAPAQKPVVYFSRTVSADSLVRIYNALNIRYSYEKAAVKLSTGETGSNYLAPELIKDLVSLVDGTIVECNTAYGGNRASTAMHYQLAKDHGYTDIAEVVIMDETDTMQIPVNGGTHLKSNMVGARFSEFDYFVILSHFKGHSMAGFGGALKNASIGIASSEGKKLIHTAGTSTSTIYYDDVNAFHESMAEAAKSVSDALDGKIVYINVMNNLSVDCDCDSEPAAPTMADIGILASTDPVALDKACVDLVYKAGDGQDLIARIESLNGTHILTHGEKIGLGSQTYDLVVIDG